MTFVELLNEYHIIPQFPPSVIKWTQTVPQDVEEKDLLGRVDLTDKLIFTIDGDDAKDFDDAVSLEVLENGNYYLGVHIADVTHYVSEDSPLDRAAFARGTSVYLIDTVIPMLPFELSNELCSLKPLATRLTVSVFMEINRRGKIVDYSIVNSFIKSKARLTYNKVTKIIEGDKGLSERYQDLVPTINEMNRLAKVLNKRRVENGSIEFETHEAKITLDKNGVPLAVEKYPITISNGIIEEFMLAANVTVAKHLTKNALPCVYRVHEEPDFDRVERLARVLPELGVDFKFKADMHSKDFQKILEDAESFDTKSTVNYLVLRSMSRARYSEKNSGHFGLGFGDYCHFTSPIRRYPDVVVHRILKESLKGNLSQKRLADFKELAISAAVNSSMTETNAAEAELRWKDIKKAEYMLNHIGEKHTATITHVTASGFFAELENTVEGFVPARTIEDDLYMITENGLSLLGSRTKRSFTIGDKVEIKVSAVDPWNGKIDFEVVGSRPLKPQRSNKLKGKSDKKVLTKEEKRKLKDFKEERSEERKQKNDLRERLDREKAVFENALVYQLICELQKRKHLTKHEKGFAGVMLGDMAAVAAMPIYRAYVFSSDEVSFKNALVAASKSAKNTLGILCDSLGIENGESLITLAGEYALGALKHFGAVLENEGRGFKKREDEYISIMNKIKARKGEEE